MPRTTTIRRLPDSEGFHLTVSSSPTESVPADGPDSQSPAQQSGAAISVSGLSKSYGFHGVLSGLDMDVAAGEVLTVFGPNGSGKTTLLRVLATLSRPDAGQVVVNGFDIASESALARSTVGVVMHSSLLYGDLTGRENLRFWGRMFGVDGVEGRIDEVAERMDVAHRLDDKVRDLSHGLQKRVSFARALLHRPKLLLLDEPETGLDQNTLTIFEGLLADYRAVGGSVVMTTHSLERGLALSDRVAILGGGKFAFVDSSANIEPGEMPGIFASLTGERQ